MALEQNEIDVLAGSDAEQRFDYLVSRAVETGELWILTDEQGSVMLNTDDEDCVPVWPDLAFAEQWATGEWSDCKPMSITLKQWNFRWTPGLEEDGFAVVVFPLPGDGSEENGLVVWPEELDMMLTRAVKKANAK
ncbi:DUF2750 domain-containing protein [Amphritea balenae]|uniref:DUF2750 domain-containing protein n=1 Tax=Amphritea balenae TaxID=452629 RepID=A0A3P1STW7_9GAMM|nr:DUF2750 domain-containing protein [Amphritea balenae]RRD00649.1 DUF2750 domain-containing protein [Amphritea balenae]GGK69022.1 hypothetical protein GCM10007941_18960 [Amphritea balenae]